MADLPPRPPTGLPPLAPGWTEHKAPSGHLYYYNRETKKSTYTRPVSEAYGHQTIPTGSAQHASNTGSTSDLFHPLTAQAPITSQTPSNYQPQFYLYGGPVEQKPKRGWQHAPVDQQRGGHRGGARGGHRGDHSSFPDRRRQQEDRPKHRHDIPNCAPWVLVKTKLGRRFVWNKETNESFWKFPSDVMKGVVEFDRKEREKRERRERGEPSDDEDDAAMAEVEAELAAAEQEIEEAEVVSVEGDEGMENEEEYEEVEVTDDEGGDGFHTEQPSKRQRTEEPTEDPGMEMGEDDMAWQLAQMEEMEAMAEGYGDEDEEEGLPLTEEDCKALFKELLEDLQINPYTPWDKILDGGALFDDDRYKALPNMKARKECFDEWAREKAQFLKEQKAKQQKLDPKIPYLAFLHAHATPKLYWPEFRRKFKKEPEMKDTKLPDKDKEKLYRDHIKRLALKPSDLKSDLSALLKAQPLASLNRDTTIDTLPQSILTDLRFISLPGSTRDSLVKTYISTLPAAPEGAAASAEEEAEAAKKRAERQRREKALADRESRVREEKRKAEREAAYGKHRLREEEDEIQRAMKVGKEGLRAQLGEYPGQNDGP
ncbi:hypothetical protein BU24DRAFT_428522 [Aaosphaeria arxii CBS 175.79]|uniref:WW domain-containing protein n=1 Tax=Aaosphaeria arxii CBS 175.79 TaxID=1450172 RepID=A0A6A5XA33_9PLEO|nr:uncharacterized protein BU24DRAFT_428522 [Aaosphaeria arxii CBS 175.79]KAF2009624.1 hypothetical protein BU24DRAFT_428522 [Aaosphaeria arxii CBS 175.79]